MGSKAKLDKLAGALGSNQPKSLVVLVFSDHFLIATSAADPRVAGGPRGSTKCGSATLKKNDMLWKRRAGATAQSRIPKGVCWRGVEEIKLGLGLARALTSQMSLQVDLAGGTSRKVTELPRHDTQACFVTVFLLQPPPPAEGWVGGSLGVRLPHPGGAEGGSA